MLVFRKSMPEDISHDPEQHPSVEAFFHKWFVGAADETLIGAHHTCTQSATLSAFSRSTCHVFSSVSTGF